MTVNPQATNYTLVLGDAGQIVYMTTSTTANLTVPTNASVAFPVGTRIYCMGNGTGVTTMVAAGGVTLTTGTYSNGAILVKLATNTWSVVYGL